MRKVVLVVVGLAVALAAGVYGYRAYLISELRKPLLAQLFDPDSAQFRNEVLYSNWTTDGSAMCGEVNAKNQAGGYVGFQPFQVVAGGGAEIESNEVLSKYRHLIGRQKCPFEEDARWWDIRW